MRTSTSVLSSTGSNDAIAPTFDKVSMLKNRPVVTSAGGPGIGQPHLSPHDHIDVVNREPMCVWCSCCPAPD